MSDSVEAERPFCILALDGGGVRGVVTAIWLRKLAERHQGFLDRVDLFAGTSMGAANAAALACDIDFDEILNIYRRAGPTLFSKRLWPAPPLGWAARLLSRVPGFRWTDTLTRLAMPKWDNAGLKQELGRVFKNTQLLSEMSRRVMFTTMHLSEKLPGSTANVVMPRLMQNFPGSASADVSLQDALMRSMAAPTYFPSYQGYVDGGVFAVNPSAAAIALSADERFGKQRIENLRLLSIGTGVSPDGIANNGRLTWGLLRWGEAFADASTTSVAEFDADLSQGILGASSYRLNAVLSDSVGMDDYHAVESLIEFAEAHCDGEAFEGASKFIEAHFLTS